MASIHKHTIIAGLSFLLMMSVRVAETFGEQGFVGGKGGAKPQEQEASGHSSLSYLDLARKLDPPVAEAMAHGDFEHGDFWEENGQIIRRAWSEWENLVAMEMPSLDSREILTSSVLQTVDQIRREPDDRGLESSVQQQWEEVTPGVYRCQLFNETMIPKIRRHLDAASYDAGIPTRRPNSMNRYGLILHHSETIGGSVDLREFHDFYLALCDVVRPVARYLFQRFVGPGDDEETYGFTVRYKADEDVLLSEHSDASLYTLNVNLNTPDEGYSGSTLLFVDKEGKKQPVEFTPGVALLHLGQHRHEALPIENGERTNLIIWFHGKHGYVRIAPYEEHEILSRDRDWKIEL